MLEEQDGIIRPQGTVEQAFRIVGRRRDDDSQSGKMGKQGIIIAGMMGRRRMADADAAPQQDRHFDPPAAHVLDFGDLVQDLAERVEDEVGEHEIDHRPGADHGRPAAQSDETPFANGRIAEPIGTEAIVKSEGRAEVAPPFADPLPHHEDRRSFCSISKVRASSVACIQVASRPASPTSLVPARRWRVGRDVREPAASSLKDVA